MSSIAFQKAHVSPFAASSSLITWLDAAWHGMAIPILEKQRIWEDSTSKHDDQVNIKYSICTRMDMSIHIYI